MKTVAFLFCLAILVGGCSSLGRSPRPDFYMLSSPAESHVSQEHIRLTGPRVAIGPVTIPGYLDRPQLFVRKTNDVTVLLEEFNQWSEPLGSGITRVLCDVITMRLQPRNGMAFPLRAAFQPQWRVSVDIGRLDGAPGEEVILDALWSLNDEQGNTVRSGRFIRRAPAGNDLTSMVEAYSKLLAGFGDEIGRAIP